MVQTVSRSSPLWDPGDISSPVGTASWCRGIHNMACGDKRNGTVAVSNLKRTLIRIRDQDHYRLLADSEGAPFTAWEDYVQYREPFGLGMRVDVVEAIIAEQDETRLLSDVIKDVPPLPKQEYGIGKAGPGRGKKTGADGTCFPSRGSNSVDYLAARIKRDHPDIAARIDEFPSMRAAAKAAGIIKDPDDIKILERMHKRADAETWLSITTWFDEHREPYRGNGSP